jgi:hypothetical protein
MRPNHVGKRTIGGIAGLDLLPPLFFNGTVWPRWCTGNCEITERDGAQSPFLAFRHRIYCLLGFVDIADRSLFGSDIGGVSCASK